MLKSILVGVDGSPHSKVAVELGMRWAKRHNALLVGLGILDLPPDGDRVPDHENRRRVEQFLEQFALQCAQAQVSCKLLENLGQPAMQIVDEAQRYDLVLLGRRTYFRTDPEAGPDETLFQVVKYVSRPVITVPDSLREGKCVLVAYDGSMQAARAVQAFANTGLGQGKEVRVLSIATDHASASRHAERAADFLRFHDYAVQAHPVAFAGKITGEVVMQLAFDHDPGLIVMGAYGQPRWREFVFGSVTRTLLKQTPAPLFLYH